MRNFIRLMGCFFLIASLLGCRSQPVYAPPPDWKYADLRALDPPEEIPPSQDLLALYLRRLDVDIEIRLDLLDFTTPLDCDLGLRIFSPTSGETTSISIPAAGEISAVNGDGLPIPGLQPRVTRDTALDTVVISLNRAAIIHNGLPYEITATSLDPGTHTPGDQIGPVASDLPPPRPVEALFAFWDTFPAATPAQALRMWDGAHNGPGRSRYGLRHLLNAVQVSQIPVILLDLNTPASHSILDFMGSLPEVQRLADRQLAILPDAAPYALPPEVLSLIPKISPGKSGASPFLYTLALPNPIQDQYRVVFLASNTIPSSSTRTSAYRWQDHLIIPLPKDDNGESPNKPTLIGPSLALRRDLIQAALDPGNSIYILGGRLANTSWGDPSCVSPTLHYLAAHPWIRFLSSDDLLALHAGHAYTPNPVTGQLNSSLAGEVLPALLGAPSGEVTDLAWETYLSLLTPASPELTGLRAGYFGISGHLLVAARWASRPGYAQDCTVDIDWDGQPECILASPGFFATFEPSGGYIVTAFARRADGVHQVIGPYAQFTVGLGDPTTWNPELGSEGDPALVPGGFVDGAGPWTPQVQAGQIAFTNPDAKISKVFRLTQAGLRVDYNSVSPLAVKVSLALDPWRRYTAGWGDAYMESMIPGGWQWALEHGPQVQVISSGTLTAQAFTASRPYLSAPEDPNFDYPPGHYLPFPLALIEINGEGSFFIQMDIR